MVVPTTPEPRYEGGRPRAYAMSVAGFKAQEVAARTSRGLVVGADTVVVWRGQVFGKPASRTEARAMLESLAGDGHEVLTAVCVIDAASKRRVAASDRAQVTMRALTTAEIERYIDTGEPMDKAGAYALQGEAGRFITAVEGDPETVIGLPTRLLRRLLDRLREPPPAR